MYVAQNNKNITFKTSSLRQTSRPRGLVGFTLIELLIVIITMFFIFTAGAANLRGFQRRRTLDGAAERLRSHLRLAQEMAISGKKPQVCTSVNWKLLSVRLQRTSATTYRIRAECTDGAGVVLLNMDSTTYNLNPEYPGITLTSSVAQGAVFESLGRGVRNAVNFRLTQTATGQFRDISVTAGGEIN